MTWKRSQAAYGRTPEPATPYQKAAQVWDERIGSARVQAKNWRLASLVSLGLAFSLTGIIGWQATQSRIVPYVVEVDSSGAVKNVTPTTDNYVPSDAQISFQLANFIRKVRGVSTDPIIVRQNWLEAYDFTTSQAAGTLSAYATSNDPFAEVGLRSVSVDIESVVRSSDSSFEIRWRETEFRSGIKQAVSAHTAMLNVITEPPSDEAALQRNPLGLYVHAINWSRDRTQGNTP